MLGAIRSISAVNLAISASISAPISAEPFCIKILNRIRKKSTVVSSPASRRHRGRQNPLQFRSLVHLVPVASRLHRRHPSLQQLGPTRSFIKMKFKEGQCSYLFQGDVLQRTRYQWNSDFFHNAFAIDSEPLGRSFFDVIILKGAFVRWMRNQNRNGIRMLQFPSTTCQPLWKIATQFVYGHPELLSPQPESRLKRQHLLDARLALAEAQQFVLPVDLYHFGAVLGLQFRW